MLSGTLLPLFLFVTLAPAYRQAEEIAVRGEIAGDTVWTGGEAEVRLTLVPPPGIHIPDEPLPEVRFDSASYAETEGSPTLDRHAGESAGTGAIIVRQTIAVRKEAPRGRQVLHATLVYYYCSDGDGWCVRTRKRIDFPMMVAR
jgi:hypothetical protein